MNKYTSKEIHVLDEIEHIRLNPAMYVGSTESPTHLIEELLDNALDEALASYATIIAVLIDTKKHEFSVLDNGRGIPLSDNTPVTVSMKLFSGAKFQDRKTAYQISSGLHGVGLIAVNALSLKYKIEIYRNKKYAIYLFEKSKFKKSKIAPHTGDIPFSTKIEFIPDKKFFETLEPNLDRIRNRLATASAELPSNIQFVLIVDDKKEVFNLSEKDHFAMNCLTGKDDELTLRMITAEKKPEIFKVLFAYEKAGSVTPKIISSINLLPVTSGGTHLNAFYELLKEFFSARAKKLGFRFQPNDCLVGLRAYLMLSLVEPKFSGQTKDKLTNRKTDFDTFMKLFRGQLDAFADRHPDDIKVYLERFQDYRRKLDSKKLTRNGSSKRSSTKFTKLRDCSSREGELYVVEGDSAGGSIIQSRDPRLHAVLPLKGKSIPNITIKSDVLKNKQIEELVTALGTGIGPHFDISKIRYSKVVCATDADHDGAHIACLLTMVMAILLPDVVKAGKYFIAQTPLFAIVEKKTFIPIWTDEELEKARKNGRNIQRYKGLGEMNPNQLRVSLLDKPTRNLIPVTYSKDIDSLIKLFSSPQEKRRLVSR